jgi:hypothetical protein
MRGIVRMRYAMDPSQGPSVWGWVPKLVSNDVSVPLHLRDRLRGLGPSVGPPARADRHGSEAEDPPARYTVTLGVGRLGAVWIEDVRRIGSGD